MLIAGCSGDSSPVVTTIVATPTETSEPTPSPSAESSPEPVVDSTPHSLLDGSVGVTITATRTAESSTDSDGNVVHYDPANVADDDPETAWRMPFNEWQWNDYILITFDRPVTITELGLIPGYAKVDSASGADRFTQNHRLCSVTWETSSGSYWSQELEEKPTMQTVPVAGEVTWLRLGAMVSCSLLEGDKPARDFIAISDITVRGTVAPAA